MTRINEPLYIYINGNILRTYHSFFLFSSAAPCLAGTNLNTKSVQLNWGAHTAAGHPAMRWDSGKAIMTEWSNSGPVDDGVNVRLCLSRHDRNGNQCIGTSELESILKVSYFTKSLYHAGLPLYFPSLWIYGCDYLYLPSHCIFNQCRYQSYTYDSTFILHLFHLYHRILV